MPELRMPQINEWWFSGRLARESDLKYTANGKAYFQNAVFVDDGFGEKKTSEAWNVNGWDKFAEKQAPLMHKGMPVLCRGRVIMECWEGKDGDTVKRPCVVLSAITYLAWHDEPSDLEKTQPRSAQPAQDYQQPEDDIPF